MFKNLKIKVKIQLIIFVSIVMVASIVAIQSAISMKHISEEKAKEYRKEAYAKSETELKNYVSLAYRTIQSYEERTANDKIQKEVEKYLKEHTESLFTIINAEYEKNKNSMSKEKLFARIKDIVSANRYGKNGYYFAYNTDGICMILPTKTELEGKDLSQLKDKNGVYIVQEAVKAAQSASGDGFFKYLWPKPGYEQPQLKVSYSKMFKPFNIVIGTGAYIDDVSSQMKQEAIEAITKMTFGKDGYFWINDSNHIVIGHGANAKLAGKNMVDLKDPNGKYIYREIVKVANENEKGGIVDYMWPKPGFEKPQPKLSFVQRFEKWDWIVGTGAYIDEIESNILAMEKATNEDIKNFIIEIVIYSLISLVLLVIASSYITKKSIEKPLVEFQNGLMNFFSYLNKETNEINLVQNDSKDEIGAMSKIVNENITNTKENLEKDQMFLDEVASIVEEVKKGYLTNRLENEVKTESLEHLRQNINEMMSGLNTNIGNDTNVILHVLDNFAKLDFRDEIKNDNGKISLALNNVAKLTTEMLIDNKANGLTLDRSSNILLENVDILNKNSNEAAAALEETAAALEEITSNIINNTDNVVKMANNAHKLNQSANEGEKLANKTTTAMSEIDQQVTAINESISVIDQIAFQTNILSLNAAVEAATAGEAGKGFAVVAQEVRNLASRSAEAAKEIKELVENATAKANEGKEIATKMIEGYSELNENIANTIELISDVELASKEQQTGIEQINDAIASLDQQTQENASISNRTHEVAVQTDTIAKLVVATADEKEFNGKDSVTMKVFDKTQTESKNIKQEINNKIFKSKPVNIIESEKEQEKWESF